eukprot:TRINITY_DN2753_c0_g1_i6.p2 TRINITY_DN2753_c0_g1~~TRINITY_DN2753_c0_g1_i6.p2  ORF type:complete len:475 (-),score=40.42 TRINITY_DN2753_c0_g1_i6:84-1508(-)
MTNTPATTKRGFTLLEILVAIAAGLLLVLAISSLFASAGGTIATGRRISEFSRTATIIEQRIREDMRHLTRDGYLLIRHAVANDGPNPGGEFEPWLVPAFSGDPNPRFRRVDEIMFFTRDEYQTARAPLSPGYVAESNVARIYYGHGAIADFAAGDNLFLPEYDMGLSGGGGPGFGGGSLQVDLGLLGQPDGPNEFAIDWRLLRHQLLLVQPSSGEQNMPSTFLEPWQRPNYPEEEPLFSDGDRQIALQPALSSLFRHVNYAYGQSPSNDDDNILREQGDYDRGRDLRIQAGIFDIATTDLREIRAWITSMHNCADFGPDYVPPLFPEFDVLDRRRDVEIFPIRPQDLEDEADLRDLPDKGPPRGYTPFIHAPNLETTNSEAYQLLFNGIHAWMRNGMPTDGGTSIAGDQLGDDVEQELHSIRMHVEPSPPELLTVLDENQYDPEELETADRLNEQLLLTANNLGARVGEQKRT